MISVEPFAERWHCRQAWNRRLLDFPNILSQAGRRPRRSIAARRGCTTLPRPGLIASRQAPCGFPLPPAKLGPLGAPLVENERPLRAAWILRGAGFAKPVRWVGLLQRRSCGAGYGLGN